MSLPAADPANVHGQDGGDIVEWLLNSDPALRRQVERDLVRAPEAVWAAGARATVGGHHLDAERAAGVGP